MEKSAVQEEILFLIYPELLMSKVICARMEKSESVVITGAKRYSNYSEYSAKTKFAGEFEDTQPLDSFGRIGMSYLS